MLSTGGNIRRFYACAVLGGLTFFHGILGFHMKAVGFTYTQILCLGALSEALCFLLEVPTGALADVYGLRKTVTVGHAISAGSCFLVAFFPASYAAFLGWAVLSAVCSSLNSGSWEALQFESLRRVGRETEYATLRGRLIAIAFAASALSGLAGGALCDAVGFPAIMVLGGLTGTVMTVIIAGMEEPLGARENHRVGAVRHTAECLAVIRARRALATVVVLGGVVLAAGGLVGSYAQPCLERVGTRSYTVVGAVSFALTATLALCAWLAGSLQRLGGNRPLLAAVCGAPVLAFVGLGALRGWALLCPLALAKAGTGLAEPVLSDLVARHTPQGKLATVLSAQNMVFSLVFAAWSALLGVGLDRAGPLPTFLASAVLLVAILALGVARLRRPTEPTQRAGA